MQISECLVHVCKHEPKCLLIGLNFLRGVMDVLIGPAASPHISIAYQLTRGIASLKMQDLGRSQIDDTDKVTLPFAGLRRQTRHFELA
jgi:hypothetical protein